MDIIKFCYANVVVFFIKTFPILHNLTIILWVLDFLHVIYIPYRRLFMPLLIVICVITINSWISKKLTKKLKRF